MSRQPPARTQDRQAARDALRRNLPGELPAAAARLAERIPSMQRPDLLRICTAAETLIGLVDDDTNEDPAPRWPMIGPPTAAALGLPDDSTQQNPDDPNSEQFAPGFGRSNRARACAIRAQ